MLAPHRQAVQTGIGDRQRLDEDLPTMAGLGQHVEGGIIVAIMGLSVGLGFVNEFRSEQTAAALRERTGTVVPTASAETIEETLGEARRRLGEAYDAAWSQGRAMSLPQATAYALGLSAPVLSCS